jgi:hypothetical protein
MKFTGLPILVTLASVASYVAIIYRHKQELSILKRNPESQSPNRRTPGTTVPLESSLFIAPVPDANRYLGGNLYQRPDGEIFTAPPDGGPPISNAPKLLR